MHRKKLRIAILLLVSLLITACGGSEQTTTQAALASSTNAQSTAPEASTGQQNREVIEVLMSDIWYGNDWNNIEKPPLWTVKSGSQISIRLRNLGSLEHNWAIVKASEDLPVPFNVDEHGSKLLWDAGLVKGGMVTTIDFTAPEAGNYTIICTVAGHYPTMQGKLTAS